MYVKCIDGQVIRLIRLLLDDFRLFHSQQTDKTKNFHLHREQRTK